MQDLAKDGEASAIISGCITHCSWEKGLHVENEKKEQPLTFRAGLALMVSHFILLMDINNIRTPISDKIRDHDERRQNKGTL